MPFCGECGNKLGDGARFCGECGTPLKSESAAAPAPTPAPAPAQPAPASIPASANPTVVLNAVDKCHTCGKSLQGNVVNAMGKKFCPGCFVCSKCKEPFDKPGKNGSFAVQDNKPVCSDCMNLAAPFCAGCGQKCTRSYMNALEKAWHKECFVCAACKTAIGSQFVVRDGNPFCNSACADKGKG